MRERERERERPMKLYIQAIQIIMDLVTDEKLCCLMFKTLRTKVDNFSVVGSFVRANNKAAVKIEGCLWYSGGMGPSLVAVYLGHINKKTTSVSGALQNLYPCKQRVYTVLWVMAFQCRPLQVLNLANTLHTLMLLRRQRFGLSTILHSLGTNVSKSSNTSFMQMATQSWHKCVINLEYKCHADGKKVS